jgi:hypothetical protein
MAGVRSALCARPCFLAQTSNPSPGLFESDIPIGAKIGMTVGFLYLRVSLGLLFVITALSKAWNRRGFRDTVTQFRIVPPRLTPAVGTAIVSVELLGGGLLLSGTYIWLGAAFLILLLVAFNVALIVNLLRGRRNLDCRCFGGRTFGIGWGHVVQNTILLIMASVIMLIAGWGDVRLGPGNPTTRLLAIFAAVYSVMGFLAAQALVSVRAGLVRVLGRRVQTE